MSDKKLRIIPLGGLGEVGKNMMAYEYGKNILIVDTGLMFPENDMLGIDYIVPDFEYLMDKTQWVRGIVVTHGHEDHTGAINHVLEYVDAPIYATSLTRGLLEVKLSRGKMLNNAQLNTVNAGETVNIGPFTGRIFPRLPLDTRRCGIGNHNPGRTGGSLRRLQVRPHTG